MKILKLLKSISRIQIEKEKIIHTFVKFSMKRRAKRKVDIYSKTSLKKWLQIWLATTDLHKILKKYVLFHYSSKPNSKDKLRDKV